MKLVVQIPCLNEEDTLPLVLSSIPDSIPGIDEIVVVVIDDGSTDATVAVARTYGVTEIVRHHRNQGLARSFTDGINHALAIGADIVVNTDGDNQYPQERIGDLVQPILRSEADIVIADRQVGLIEHFSPAKKALQRFGSKVVNVAARTELPDAASGFRAYSRESLMRLNTVTRFSYCMETIIQAGNKNLAIASLPVLTNARTRESRLFSSTRQHVFRSGAAIVRAYVMYRPYVIFGVMAALFGVLGLVPYVRYAVLAATGEGGGHVQSLLVGAALVVMSSLCLMLGIVSDLIRTNRSLIETNLEHTKRARYDVLRVPHTAAIDTVPYETGGHPVKTLYIRAVRALAIPLRATGVLAILQGRAPHSRTATWLASLLAIHDVDGLRQLDVPWWTFDSADRVADWLRDRPEARVFEWGSGASTLWLAARAGTVHSVEHHAGWAGVLAPRLPANVDLRVVEAVASSAPVVRSAKPGHADLDFAAYVAAIDDVPGDFDVVVIDGRAREACLARAVERLAPGGLIVFDNVDRQRYVDAIEAVGDRLTLTMTRGLTPALPYPTRTALLRSTEPAEAP